MSPTTDLAPDPDGPARDQGLRGKVLGGLRWKTYSTVAVQLSRIAVAVLLARLLVPEDFGLAAIVLVFSGLAFILTDVGLGAALVQRPEIDEGDRSTVFWMSATLGLLLSLAIVAASGPIAGFYSAPDAQPLLIAFSSTFLLAGLSTTQGALLSREMAFRSLELRSIVATVVGGATGVGVALAGGGAWAIVVQSISATAISTLLLWTSSSWRPRLMFSLGRLRVLGGYGLKALGTRVIWDLNRNTDNVLIGRFLGVQSLGVYALAFNLMLFPLSRIAAPIRSVMFPAFSRIQDDRARLTDGWLRSNRALAAVTAPVVAGVIVVAPELVTVVLGDQWRDAIPVLQVLAGVGLIQALMQIGGSVFYAIDRSGRLFTFTLATYALNVVAFVVGLQWGILGVSVAYLLASAVTLVCFTEFTARALNSSSRAFVLATGGPLAAAGAMALALLAVRAGLAAEGIGDAATLALLIGVGGVLYVPLCLGASPALRSELRRMRGPRSGAPRDA